jgi:hypothetical protein
MSMLTHRLQVLIDDERYKRLQNEAERRDVPVAVIVREAIDTFVPTHLEERRRALEHLLQAVPIDVPDDPTEIKREYADDRMARLG